MPTGRITYRLIIKESPMRERFTTATALDVRVGAEQVGEVAEPLAKVRLNADV